MDAFNQELNRLLVMAYRKIVMLEEEIINMISGMELTISEMHMLEAVDEKKDGGIPLYELAQNMGLSAPSVTVAINKLQKKGYVEKSKSEKDKRSVTVALTRMGKKMNAAHRYFHEQMVRDIDKLLLPSEREGLLRGIVALNRFFDNAFAEVEAKKQERRIKNQNESM